MIIHWLGRFCAASLLLALAVAALSGTFIVLLMLITVLTHH